MKRSWHPRYDPQLRALPAKRRTACADGLTTKEEGGMVGNQLEPDYAIVLDTIPAGDTPDIETEKVLSVSSPSRTSD